MFPIPWNKLFRKKDGSITTLDDAISAGGGGEPYTLPTASAEIKGGIKIGNRLTMVGDVLNADPQMPSYSSSESGKVLEVDSEGHLEWATPSGGGGGFTLTPIDTTQHDGNNFTLNNVDLTDHDGFYVLMTGETSTEMPVGIIMQKSSASGTVSGSIERINMSGRVILARMLQYNPTEHTLLFDTTKYILFNENAYPTLGITENGGHVKGIYYIDFS